MLRSTAFALYSAAKANSASAISLSSRKLSSASLQSKILSHQLAKKILGSETFPSPTIQKSQRFALGESKLQISSAVNSRLFSTSTSPLSTVLSESNAAPEANIVSAETIPASLWDSESKKLFKLLSDQHEHFATVVLKGKKFTITKSDLIVMDRMNDLNLGDVISLSQITELGSKDFTLTGSPYISNDLVSIEATVVEHPETELITTFKKKRRKGYQRTVKHKHRRTLLRVSKLEVLSID